MLVKSYHRNNKPVGCAKKVDILKAYDSNEWDFVLALLSAIGCPAKFLYWTKVCLTTTKYSIAITGGVVGYFGREKRF